MTVPSKMNLICVVRRDIEKLSKRKCNFSDAVLDSSHFVNILPDPQMASLFTIANNKEIGVQCQACDFSENYVS